MAQRTVDINVMALETCCHVCLARTFGKPSYAPSCCICMLHGIPCGLTYSNAIETMCNLGWSTSNSVRACYVTACKCLILKWWQGPTCIHKLEHRMGRHRLASCRSNGAYVTLEANVAGVIWSCLVASLHLLWIRIKANAHVGYMDIIE